MGLTLVATPIGHIDDISARAVAALNDCEVLILEEFREGSSLIKRLGIERKEMVQLNEHTRPDEISELVKFCEKKHVCLVSDCGTPNFCDPGAVLVRACRERGIPVRSLPGASSLMVLLSLSSQRLDNFLFRGFLPANNEQRKQALSDLKKTEYPVVVMDTPYRMHKLLQELAEVMPKRRALLGINLTCDDETVQEGTLRELAVATLPNKAEFALLIYKG